MPHRTPMTPKDLLAVHLHWKGSRDCRMLRLAHMRMQSNNNYYYYAAFNALCVGHKDDESQAQTTS